MNKWVQTIMSRLEEKGAVRRTRKIGNALLFAPVVTRKSAYRRLIGDFLGLFEPWEAISERRFPGISSVAETMPFDRSAFTL